MAKLTKAQRRDIEAALRSVNRAIEYIEQDRVAICIAATTNSAVDHTGDGSPGHEFRAGRPFERKHYKGREGMEWSIDRVRTLTPVNKGIGSDLVAVYTARDTLTAFLNA